MRAASASQPLLDPGTPSSTSSPPTLVPSTSQLPSEVNRLSGIDAARVAATFAIVWVHVVEAQGGSMGAAAVGRFGTSFYVIAAALFAVRGAVKTTSAAPVSSAWQNVKSRAGRILRPFLVWSLIYGAYYAATGRSEGTPWKEIAFWWGPFAGTAVHLWFLPFVFFWGVVASLSAPTLLRLSPARLTWVGVSMFLAVTAFCYGWLFFEVSRPLLWKFHLHRLDRWIEEVPLFLLATLLAVGYEKLGSEGRARLIRGRRWTWMAGLGIFLLAQLLYAIYADAIREKTLTDGRFVGNFAALGLALLFLSRNDAPWIGRLAPLGRFTYLAFLSHMLFVELTRGSFVTLPGYGTLPFALLTSVCIFAASLALSFAIQNLRGLAVLRA